MCIITIIIIIQRCKDAHCQRLGVRGQLRAGPDPSLLQIRAAPWRVALSMRPSLLQSALDDSVPRQLDLPRATHDAVCLSVWTQGGTRVSSRSADMISSRFPRNVLTTVQSNLQSFRTCLPISWPLLADICRAGLLTTISYRSQEVFYW